MLLTAPVCARSAAGTIVSEQEPNTVITPEELEAAIAEVEAMAPGHADIPNLDDGNSNQVVPIPVPAPPVQAIPPVAASEGAAPTPPPEPASDAAQPDAPPTDKPRRQGKIGQLLAALTGKVSGILRALISRLPSLRRRKKPEDEPADQAAPAPPQPAATPEDGPSGEDADGDAGKPPPMLIIRVLDIALELINRPFTWVPPSARQVLGIAGVVTILVSMLAMVLFPLVLPHDDPITFLRQKRAEQLVVAPEPTPEAPTP
jgi:hypothetical protein